MGTATSPSSREGGVATAKSAAFASGYWLTIASITGVDNFKDFPPGKTPQLRDDYDTFFYAHTLFRRLGIILFAQLFKSTLFQLNLIEFGICNMPVSNDNQMEAELGLDNVA